MPISTFPVPTVDPVVIDVIFLNTFSPVDVKPPAAPIISSICAFPDISVPTTVKIVDDWSPPEAVDTVTLPANKEVVFIAKAVLSVIEFDEKSCDELESS